eukprot:Selendium_serpulae@DN3853_c0_g1_i1.p1
MPIQRLSERLASGDPLLLDDEQVTLTVKGCGLAVDSQATGTSPATTWPGDLFVTTKRLVWLAKNEVEMGLGCDFQSIGLHALSRDAASFPQPCIYCQVASAGALHAALGLPAPLRVANRSAATTATGGDTTTGDDGEEEGGSTEDVGGTGIEETAAGTRLDDEEDEGLGCVGINGVATVPRDGLTVDVGTELPGEMRLVPENQSLLDEMFHVMTEMAALNPDPEDEEDELLGEEDMSDMMAAMMLGQVDGGLPVGDSLWRPELGAGKDDSTNPYDDEKDLEP